MTSALWTTPPIELLPRLRPTGTLQMLNLKKFASLLLPLVLLSACAKTEAPALIAADKLCRDWTHQQIRKADQIPDPTASQIEANNKSRPNWGCAYGKNESQTPPSSASVPARS
jgi:hypothetical protein